MSRVARLSRICVFALAAAGIGPGPAAAQPAPAALEKVTFDEAIARATSANPSIASAAAAILRADALLRQARAEALPTVQVQGTNTTLDSGRGFEDTQLTPRNTFGASIPVSMPLYAPATWARRRQAEDNRQVAEASADEVRRQIAVATGQAYLAVIAAGRVVEAQQRAVDTARAFYEYAHQRYLAGASSRLNELRAQQTLSTDEALLEEAQLALYRTQEALGVLIAADGPVDVAGEPAFDIPDEAQTMADVQDRIEQRTDIRLFSLEVDAARRVVEDSRKEWFPSVAGIFEPQFQKPGSIFSPEASWRALIQFQVPVFDSGARRGRRLERQALLQQREADLGAARREAASEVRAAYEALRRSERVLERTRAAAEQAQQVLEITNISFRAGATTNIEVVDAQRRARDADTAVAVAEDGVRRARLDLLNALGRFP
ncbi:MAG TPA: TolC family protein [Vicinamibacterales bacterium]